MNRMHIATPQQRIQARQLGERQARMSLVQLLCAISILRTALTRIVPAAGGAAWWTALVALLPGVAVFLLAVLAMRLTHTATLMELVRRCLGRTGVWLMSATLAGALLADGASTLTALLTLFTQGLGTRGTQTTLALLTGGALCLCLNREGLARGVVLLRWVLLMGAAVVAALLLPALRTDHFFPLQGGGMATVGEALRAGASLSWPLLLLLTLPRGKAPRLASACPVVLGVLAALLLICLSIPGGLLGGASTLAESLMLPARYLPPALRLLVYCLLMLGFFLAVAADVQLGTEALGVPLGRVPRWLPWVGLTLLVAVQMLEVQCLWDALTALSPWLLLPLAALTAACLALAARPPEKTR